uniref:Flagellar hook-associated protein 2 n=1 Tax=Solibacter usitatus (strain Ellin6076) TaxID=234267 RepID=Q02C74_SOLUE
MATSSSGIFTGSSQFSADFQNVISRATAIASLPITQLNTDKTNLSSQATALTGLDGKFKALQSAIQGIADSLTGSAFQATVSDPTKAGVSVSTGAAEGDYTIDVVNAGVYATSMTASNWVGGTDSTRTYQLSLGGVKYSLSPANNSAASLVSAINSSYGDKVRATLVNVGSSASPDYRISLQAVKLGDLKPGLLIGSVSAGNLQTQQTTGSNTLATSQTGQSWDSNPALNYQLSIGGTAYDIVTSDTTAQGVADAINSQFGNKVKAAVVDVGNGTSDYRINLTAAGPGNTQPDILAADGISGPASLQTQLTAGSDTRSISQTASPWVAPAGPALGFQLSLGGVNYSLTVADNSLDGVVSALNSQYGSKITASKIDVGTGGSHDYRISLTTAAPGDLQPNIVLCASDVQTQQATGAMADYIVNNSGRHATSDTRSVTIATGITVTLLARDNGAPVDIVVTRPTSAVSSALSGFVTAYNDAVDEIDQQHGTSVGALTGQSALGALSRVLSGMATYSQNASGISGLADLGIDLDKTGHLTFNQFTLIGTDLSNSAGVDAFLGSTSSGFLKLATDSLNSVEDSVTGILPTWSAGVQDQITNITQTIADQQARVDQMTQRMTDQISAADALIATMEQQYNYLSGMFQAMQTADAQYK